MSKTDGRKAKLVADEVSMADAFEVLAEARRLIEAEIQAGRRYVLDRELRDRLDAGPPPPPAAASVGGPPRAAGAAAGLTLAERRERLAALAERVLACTRCGLAAGRNKVVVGTGQLGSRLMLIGEAPGHDEDQTGEPFVGRAGQLLNRILAAIGLERGEVYIANIIKCRPPENRNPTPSEIAACVPFVREQVDLVAPRVICALGRVAATTLLKSTATLAAMRGRVHEFSGIPLVVTYHPSALLRYQAYKRPTWEDMQVVQRLLAGASAEEALLAGARA
jgi:DNA polymerase